MNRLMFIKYLGSLPLVGILFKQTEPKFEWDDYVATVNITWTRNLLIPYTYGHMGYMTNRTREFVQFIGSVLLHPKTSEYIKDIKRLDFESEILHEAEITNEKYLEFKHKIQAYVDSDIKKHFKDFKSVYLIPNVIKL